MSEFGKRMKLARKRKGLTQEELARRINSTPKTIHAYEAGTRGKFRPNIQLVFRIADELDVSIQWLLKGVD